MPLWYHYHSALELGVAVNLALFAIPYFRQPSLEGESRRWVALRQLIPLDHPEYVRSHENAAWFRDQKQEIEARIDRVRGVCLVFVVLCSAVLLWGTWFADSPPDKPLLVPWLIIVLSLALPALWFWWLDYQARSLISASSECRQELERQVIPG